MEFRRMFSNPMDHANCFIDIQAGAGGTEAQDWASMLLRQYLRYCERKGFKAEILEQSDGEVAGIKTATIKVEGEYAYGHLRTETGVHRLVRKSPFDSANGRHTSFTSLFVYPEVDESFEIEINPADVRIDTYRASGAGGQHINKTDSAVRLTHAPSGIVVQCQNDRSQHRNKAEAFDMLRAKLFELEMRKRMSEQQKLEDSKTDVGWGHQIRSYVLDQSRIKDLRTNFETGNTKNVLDGDLDDFISASLKQGRARERWVKTRLHLRHGRHHRRQHGLPHPVVGRPSSSAAARHRCGRILPHDGRPPGQGDHPFAHGRDLTDDEVAALNHEKEAVYRELYAPHLKAVDGFEDLIAEAKRKASRWPWPRPRRRPTSSSRSMAWTCAAISTPSSAPPMSRAASRIRTCSWKRPKRCGAEPANCIVFEDAPLGVEAARRAGMRAVVITTTLPAAAFAEFDNVIAIVGDFSSSCRSRRCSPDAARTITNKS
jgi:peptide chain release factor 2